MNLEEILLTLAFIVALAIVGTMDYRDAELAASTSTPSLQQETKP